MKHIKTLWALPLIGLLSMPAFANGDYSNFHQRIDKQHMKIKKGVKSGDLTRKEAKILRKQHRHIVQLNNYFNKDGKLNHFERLTLKRELKLARADIHQLRKNDKYRSNHRKGRGEYSFSNDFLRHYSLN